MPNEERNIKDYGRELGIFVFMNVVIYLFFAFGSVFTLNILNIYVIPLIESSVFLSILAFVAFVIDGLLSSDFKAQIVFLKRKNPYPGCYVFTNLTDDDLIIDKSKLIDKYGELPLDPVAQNRLWYKVFHKCQYATKILESHRKFLLFRDLTGLSFVIIFIAPAVALISQIVFHITFSLLWLYVPVLAAQYILISKAARNCGNRFVYNVLAVDNNSPD